jgi:hypothetical protein
MEPSVYICGGLRLSLVVLRLSLVVLRLVYVILLVRHYLMG